MAVPVVLKDEKRYYGFLDLVNIVSYICEHFGAKAQRDLSDFWAMMKEEEKFGEKTVNDLMQHPRSRKISPFHSVFRGYSACAVIEPIAREPALRRIAVIDRDTHQLYNLVTESMIIRFIHDRMATLGPVKDKPLRKCDGILKPVITVNESSRAIDAFAKMVDEKIGGVAVINDDGRLVGALSLRDIKAVSFDVKFFWRLHQSVAMFLQRLEEEYTLRRGRPSRVQCLVPDEPLSEAIDLIYFEKIHRVFVVDDRKSKKPIGVVSIKDIARELITVSK